MRPSEYGYASMPAERRSMSIKKANFLIVDDEASLRAMLVRFFAECGYQVRSAEDGFSALAKIRSETPDIILSDLDMPGMSGLSFSPLFAAVSPPFRPSP
jgi:CheY-like chemotaxis protein